MGILFGTDGIRGVANKYPVTCEIALSTGRAVGLFTKESGFDTVIIGKDTRISGFHFLIDFDMGQGTIHWNYSYLCICG